MKMTTKLITLLSAIALFASANIASAEIAIIVNPDAGISNASKTEVVNVFLSKSKSMQGKKLKPYDLVKGQSTRDQFYTTVVKKNESQLKAYWSRLIFTGKGLPPATLGSEQEVLDIVASDPTAIAYISKDKVNSSVKVLATF